MRKVPTVTRAGEDRLGKLYALLREERLDDLTAARLHRRVMAAIETLHAGAGRESAVGRQRRFWAPLASAAALALLFGAVLWMQGARQVGEVQILSVQANGGVHLQWSDAGKDRYQVIKSTDPADFSRAERLQVRGTRYVDESPGSARVVYYRVD